MNATTLNRIIDVANLIPLPTVLLAYPLDLAARLCGDGSRTFIIPNHPNDPGAASAANVSGGEVQLLLWSKGIRIWGHYVMPPPINDLVFSVKASQARFAEHILTTNGIEWI